MSDQNISHHDPTRKSSLEVALSERVEEVEAPLGVLTSNTAPIQSVGESTNPFLQQSQQSSSKSQSNNSNRCSSSSSKQQQQQQAFQQKPMVQQVSSFGSFPGAGSQLGPYFCLGRLGRGTFCSIHRCIDMRYFHTTPSSSSSSAAEKTSQNNNNNNNNNKKHRTVAAKVELSNFANSGVLDGEANMLQHLDQNTTHHAVPIYFGHYRSTSSSSTTTGESDSDMGGGGVDSTTINNNNNNAVVPPPSASAIVMEYLPGEDMHILRNRHTQKYKCRRLAIPDAVYLTADVMIPLLQKMHNAGIVHRDVKPSNCIRRGTTSSSKDFLMVDFGLSKSIVVPADSTYADPNHEWHNDLWNKPPQFHKNNKIIKGHLRKERPTAEFRGTSMYASLRVHQSKDYSRRDDMWSLLYVFCDLVSGGLPWMSHAATRDREACRKLKEVIHGEVQQQQQQQEGNGGSGDTTKNGNSSTNEEKKDTHASKQDEQYKDQTEQLLMGDEHHVTKYNHEVAKKKGVEKLPSVSPPLALSNDTRKVQLLRDAFQHVAQLSFTDEPDYKFLQKCIRGFLDDHDKEDNKTATTTTATITTTSNGSKDGSHYKKDRKVERIDWECDLDRKTANKRKRDDSIAPTWVLDNYPDPLDVNILYEAEMEAKTQAPIGEPIKKKLKLDESDMARLPLLLQFRIAQMEYNTKHASNVEPHIGLRDWLNCVYLLTHDEWDTSKNERGNHRCQNDGYRQDVLLRVMEKCVEGAKAFDNFRHCSCLKEKVDTVITTTRHDDDDDKAKTKMSGKEELLSKKNHHPLWKLRKISTSLVGENITFATVSIAIFALARAIKKEQNKKSSPPPALSFGSGIGGDQSL